MKVSKLTKLILIEGFAIVILLGIAIGRNFSDSSEILSADSNVLSEEKKKTSTDTDNTENDTAASDSEAAEEEASGEDKEDYIKWVDFKVTKEAMQDAYEYDVNTHDQKIHLDWIALLAYEACKNGGDFSQYKTGDMDEIAEKLLAKEETPEHLSKELQYYDYYYETYDAVLGGLVGDYEIETITNEQTGEKNWEKQYGLKGFLPLAKNFPYTDYDDFGASRSYGYARPHLGHDMMGQIGTPVIAVESGYVEALGWNQYGGWRIGIRSFDKKRYYYYAHLRQDFPYNKALKEGSVVTAGDVIGYLGHTGYSTTENVNNIDTPHLHFGLQIIFDESQKDGNNEIWVSCYELTRFLYQNRSETAKDETTKEWVRILDMKEEEAEKWEKAKAQ